MVFAPGVHKKGVMREEFENIDPINSRIYAAGYGADVGVRCGMDAAIGHAPVSIADY